MPKYLRGEEVAQRVDPATKHIPTVKGQPQVVREQPHYQPHQTAEQSHASHNP
ncbi:hypothetical protein DPMN_013033 [Dreissena polymorpha]|uniref:Uncharacterized protein n=1 Tax=Dreissena polymorpha TaxID=45954 RepID=A0A9D4N952_DREPO|nr:hypothetical protein DPMN_013033 [Dreissena polymorpha]